MDHIQGQYLMQDGHILKGKKLCIQVGSMIENIIKEFHSSGLVGHFGKDKNIIIIEDKYYCLKMKKYTNKYMERCRIFQIDK